MGQSYCKLAPADPWHAPYHDREYGFPVADPHREKEATVDDCRRSPQEETPRSIPNRG